MQFIASLQLPESGGQTTPFASAPIISACLSLTHQPNGLTDGNGLAFVRDHFSLPGLKRARQSQAHEVDCHRLVVALEELSPQPVQALPAVLADGEVAFPAAVGFFWLRTARQSSRERWACGRSFAVLPKNLPHFAGRVVRVERTNQEEYGSRYPKRGLGPENREVDSARDALDDH